MNMCSYKCGNEGVYILKNGNYCCEDSHNKCPSVKKKNSQSKLGNQYGKACKGYKPNKKPCPVCGMLVDPGNYKRHVDYCNEVKRVGKRFCLNCNKEISIRNKFCSRQCSSTYRKGKPKPNISRALLKAYKNGLEPKGGKNVKWYEFTTYDKRVIKAQGSYELRACKIFDSLKQNNQIKNWNRSKVRISYKDNLNKKHTYFPDFELILNDGSLKLIEIKGFERPTDQLKWNSTRNKGFELEVWFNEELCLKEGTLGDKDWRNYRSRSSL